MQITTKVTSRYPAITPSPTLETRFKQWLLPLLRLSVFVRVEARSSYKLPIAKRLRAWRNGFLSRSYLLYDLDRNEPGSYFPDIACLSYTISDPHYSALSNKLHFSSLMQLHGVPHPRVLGFLHRGCLHEVDSSPAKRAHLEHTLQSLVQDHGRLVVKPCASGHGIGMMFVNRDDGNLALNDASIEMHELVELVDGLDHYYVSEFIEQGDYARNIFPGSPNTLRVLTVWDVDTSEPFVAAVAQRIGTSRSIPVDNFHQGRGGISVHVDPESGRMGKGTTLDETGRKLWYSDHPETGAPIEGAHVPHWQRTRQRLLDVAARFPQVPFIGWDVIVTNSGFSVLEANCPPGVAVCQAHGPLLADERCRRFFEYMGLIKT